MVYFLGGELKTDGVGKGSRKSDLVGTVNQDQCLLGRLKKKGVDGDGCGRLQAEPMVCRLHCLCVGEGEVSGCGGRGEPVLEESTHGRGLCSSGVGESRGRCGGREQSCNLPGRRRLK